MKRFLFLLAMLCIGGLQGENLLIEAESLPTPGKWQLGTAGAASQRTFVEAREKNAVASGHFCFETPGTYYVWVRNMSFSESWRRATVAIDGRKASSVGDEKTTLDTPAWIWSKSKRPLIVAKGEHKVELFADAANARIDAILLTTDKNYAPEEGKMLPEGSFRRLLPTDVSALKGKLEIGIACDKPAIAYRCGETITFRLAPRCDGKPLTAGKIRYCLRGDDGKSTSGEFQLTEKTNSFTLQTTLDRPGFCRLTCDLVDDKGELLQSVDAAGRAYQAHFDGGAGAEIDRIPACPEPADFDAFWTAQKARLEAVPMVATVQKIDSHSDAEFTTYAIEINCAGNRPATGFLIMPNGAAEKTLKAEVHFDGYGIGFPAIPGAHRRKAGKMVFFVNAHGAPLKATREEYVQFFAERKNYALTGNETPEKCYFLNMVLRDLRATQYLVSRPEWNGVDLEVVGGSQGGLQSLWMAALEPRVSQCSVEVPWNCNIGGRTLGLMAPDWGIREYTPALGYFDAANHAKRIACRVDVSRAGLGDYTCPPSGIARMYYNLACPKSIKWYQNSNHSKVPENPEIFVVEGNEMK